MQLLKSWTDSSCCYLHWAWMKLAPSIVIYEWERALTWTDIFWEIGAHCHCLQICWWAKHMVTQMALLKVSEFQNNQKPWMWKGIWKNKGVLQGWELRLIRMHLIHIGKLQGINLINYQIENKWKNATDMGEENFHFLISLYSFPFDRICPTNIWNPHLL